jgi:hypothetical protein
VCAAVSVYAGAMIPYADLERAIARWKARQSGAPEANTPVVVPHTEVNQYADVTHEHAAEGSGLISIEDDEPTRH